MRESPSLQEISLTRLFFGSVVEKEIKRGEKRYIAAFEPNEGEGAR
jgi:hypothetical protein